MEQDREVIAPYHDSPERSDEELLSDYRGSGDRGAFEQLVHRYERELYNYLRQYLGDAQMAEDVFQTTFLQVHLKCDSFDASRKVRPWLYTVATNQAIDAQRRNRRHRMLSLDQRFGGDNQEDLGALVELLDSGVDAPLARLETDEREEVVRDALDQLPDSLKQVITLVYYQGLKYREAAEILSIPVGTVKSRLHAAMYKLNLALTDTSLSNHD
ncbi:MAG: sigma-70 family RNA polymerase sigma factor [Pirellulales bacterium]|nr:sigma-70 family RNA polymerase sigma factor [Pirellulales bacterium]